MDAHAHLRTMFEHHIWATLALVDDCARLAPEQLQLTAAGTYGTIAATLDHLVGADDRYLSRLESRPLPPRPGPRGLPEVRSAMESQAARWMAVLERIDSVDISMPAIGGDEPYPEIRHATGLVLLQALHHGNDHRTHVSTILGAHGLEVPELAGWDYYLQLAEKDEA